METKQIKTLDGEKVQSDRAKSLGYPRVAMAMKAARNPDTRNSLAGIRKAMQEMGPDAYCVSSEETPKAKALAALIGGIQLPKRKDEDGKDKELPPVWVSYTAAAEGWEKFQTARSEKQAEASKGSAEPPVDPIAQIKAKAEEAARKNAATAAALDEFIPAEVKARRQERSAARKAQDAEVKKLEELIDPVVHGHCRVDSNSRPQYLILGDHKSPITYKFPISYLEDLLVGNPIQLEAVRVKCSFCGEEHALGDTREMFDRAKNQMAPKLVMRQIMVPALTEDGKNEYVFRRGQHEGQLKKMYLVVCRSCGSIATRLSPPDKGRRDGKQMPSVLPKDLFGILVNWKARSSSTAESFGSTMEDGGVGVLRAVADPPEDGGGSEDSDGAPETPRQSSRTEPESGATRHERRRAKSAAAVATRLGLRGSDDE